jgi:nitrate reductase gamma subunit
MGIKFSFVAVLTLILVVFLGVKSAHLEHVFGVYVPYAAVCVFFLGFIYRIVLWARSPVPFRIPTTGGQQQSLPWVKQNKLDNPSTAAGTIGRMLLEILLFRSLFRNTKMELHEGPKLTYQWEKWLWLAGLAFHYSFLVIFLRHLRFFIDPIPFFVQIFEKADSVMQVGLPLVYLSDLVLVAAVSYLFIRRVVIPQMRYISLAADYFPLLLILALAITGILMRYLIRIDVTSVKDLTMSLVTFHPVVPKDLSVLFYIHFFLICVLFTYFPFSKLMHLGGVFLSPTRNLPNDSRIKQHLNPWNYPVKVHTYEAYEDEFREKMIEAGLPVEKE